MYKCLGNLIIGVWFLVSSFIPELQLTGNMMASGGLLIMLSWNYKNWLCIACGVMGVWGFLSGLFLQIISVENFIFMGVVVTLLSFMGVRGQLVSRKPNLA